MLFSPPRIIFREFLQWKLKSVKKKSFSFIINALIEYPLSFTKKIEHLTTGAPLPRNEFFFLSSPRNEFFLKPPRNEFFSLATKRVATKRVKTRECRTLVWLRLSPDQKHDFNVKNTKAQKIFSKVLYDFLLRSC